MSYALPDPVPFFRRHARYTRNLTLGIGLAGLFSLHIMAVYANHPDVDWGALNLNSQQTQQINQTEVQWKATASQIMPQLNNDKSELRQLLNAPNGDQRRILELQNRINSNKTKLHNAAMQSFLRKKEYLNPQQQQQLHQMLGPNLR